MKHRIRAILQNSLLTEKRRDHSLSRFKSVEEELFELAHRDDIYITFSDVLKVGLNPKTSFGTPAGIYTYPLKEILGDLKYWESGVETWERFLMRRDIFGSERKYVHVLQANVPVFDVSKYTVSMLNKDIKQLWKMVWGVIPTQKSIDALKRKIKEIQDDNDDHALSLFIACSILYEESSFEDDEYDEDNEDDIDRDRRGMTNKTSLTWQLNKMLRGLGYKAFSDKKGKGLIHHNEPIQAFFLSKEYVTHIKTLDNKMVRKEPPVKDINEASKELQKKIVQRDWRKIRKINNPKPTVLYAAYTVMINDAIKKPHEQELADMKEFLSLIDHLGDDASHLKQQLQWMISA